MIRVVFFDLRGTLIDANQQPLPGVFDALAAISEFRASNGKGVLSCLVSDFDMVSQPVTAAKIRPIFQRYLTILDETGLRTFFEPVEHRVTLSTHAGKRKPARAIFVKALQRLGTSAQLTECLLVTENLAHIDAARGRLQMPTVLFGSGSKGESFSDWIDAPGIIARLVGANGPANVRSLVQSRLASDGIEVATAEQTSGRLVRISGKLWHPIQVRGHSDLGDLHVGIPIHGTVRLDQSGDIVAKDIPAPSSDEITEAHSFVESLAAHGQIAGRSLASQTRATHAIETDKQGRRKLIRKGFSAV